MRTPPDRRGSRSEWPISPCDRLISRVDARGQSLDCSSHLGAFLRRERIAVFDSAQLAAQTINRSPVQALGRSQQRFGFVEECSVILRRGGGEPGGQGSLLFLR